MAELRIPAGDITLNSDDSLVLAFEAALRDVLAQRACVALRFGEPNRHVSCIVGPSTGVFVKYESEDFPELDDEWIDIRQRFTESGLVSGYMHVPSAADIERGREERAAQGAED